MANYLKSFFLWGLFFLSFLASVYGFFHQSLLKEPVWSASLHSQFLILFFSIIFILKIINYYTKLSYVSLFVYSFVLILLFFVGVLEALTLLLFAVSATLYGEIIRAFLLREDVSDEDFRGAELVNSVSVGMVFLMFILRIFAHFKINYDAVHLALIIAPFFLIKYSVIIKKIKKVFLRIDQQTVFFQELPFFVFTFLASIYFVYAALPESFHDATSVYFPIAEYLKSHSIWHFDPSKAIFSTMSIGAVWLEASIYRFGGEISAKLLCWISTMLTSVLIYEFLLRDKVSKVLAMLCTSLFLSAGAVFLISISMFYDAHLMLIITSAYFLTLSKDFKKQLPVIALLCAGAIFIKISAIFPVASIFIYIFINLYKEYKIRTFKFLILPLLIGIAIATPAYIFSYIKTGNPFFPFMNGVFKSSYMPVENIVTPLPGKLTAKILYDMTFKSGEYLESYKGSFGFHFLLFIPIMFIHAFLYRKERINLMLLLFIPFVVLQLKIDHNIRYLTQFMPIFICGIGIMISQLLDKNKWLGRLNYFSLIFVLPLNFYFISGATGPIRNTDILAAFIPNKILEFKKQFASQSMIANKAALIFASRAKIISLNAGGLGAVEADLLYNNWYNGKLFKELVDTKEFHDFDRIFKKWGITHVIVRQDNQYYNRENIHKYLEANSKFKLIEGSNIAYRLKDEVIFSKEYSVNSDLNVGIENWEISQVQSVTTPFLGAKIGAGGYMSQNFKSVGKKIFKINIDYKCTVTPELLSVSISFADEFGQYFTGERWDTLCSSEDSVQSFEREFASPEETYHVKFALGGLDKEILIDRVLLVGSEEVLE